MIELSLQERNNLKNFLERHFNIEDLHDLAFTIDIPHESVPHETVKQFARELVLYCERRDIVIPLLSEILRQRPNVSNELTNLLEKLNRQSMGERISGNQLTVHVKGSAIVNNTNLPQFFENKINISSWPPLKKLALAFATGASDVLPNIESDPVEFVNLEIAELLDDSYTTLKQKIEDSRYNLKKLQINTKKLGEIESMIIELISPILSTIQQLSSENVVLYKALIDLQSSLEKKGVPQFVEATVMADTAFTIDSNIIDVTKKQIDAGYKLDAITSLKQYLERDQNLIEGHILLVETLYTMRRYDELIEWSFRIPLSRVSPNVRIFLVLAYYCLEKFEAAKEEFLSIEKEFPNYPHLRTLKQQCFF